MGADGPSLKRRRTDRNPAMSANEVAQVNSTLHLFTGRHNRWMHGWVAQSPSEAEHALVNPSTKPRPREQNAPTRPQHSPGNDAAPDARLPDPAGAVNRTNASHVSSHSSPLEPMTVSSSARKTIMAAQPGLPSPATSEDTGSPSLESLRHTTSTMAQREQPSNTVHGHPPAPLPSQSLPSSSGTHIGQPPAIVPYSSPAWTTHGHTPAASRPLQPPQVVPQQPLPMDNDILSRITMSHRFDSFHAHEATTFKLNDVEKGRLTLLREAITKGDLFYVVLSQIHALRNTPHLIPTSAQSLHPNCFYYMDKLLCGNDHVTPAVLGWLSMFPAPILNIYFAPQTSAIYEPVVKQVACFLSRLPHHWDQFEQACINRKAPPLVEEMAITFQLPSPVLQATIFRAIARMVVGAFRFAHAESAIDRLEQLHRMDQETFQQGYRRTPENHTQAIHGFYKAAVAWKLYEEATTQRDSSNTPTLGKKSSFSFFLAPEITSVFQLSPHTSPGAFPQGQPARPDTAQQQLLMQQQAAQRASAQLQPSRTPSQPHPIRRRDLVFPIHSEPPRAQPTNPDPSWSALHQAHLRSPKPIPSKPAMADKDGSRLYRHVVGFALPLTKIQQAQSMQYVGFNMPEDKHATVAVYVPPKTPGEPPSFTLDEETQTYRLRCAAYPPSGYGTEASWTVADTYWPDCLFLEFNGNKLEERRKLQYNRYLPIDVTPWIKAGENTVRVVINRASNDTRPFEYCFAVEMVGATSYANIKERLTKISAKESLATIRKTLSTEHNDSEIAITSSGLTIKLFDPYSNSKIFDIPVRGSACQHKDCFDLETFLGLCKRESHDGPSVIDCWRCPLCRGDVRPQTLVIDGFLVEVRKQLEQMGLLDTRAITVEADGTWRPKEEELLGVRSPSLEREERGESAASGKKVTEVIEID